MENRIAVLLSSYNGEKYIQEQINSIMKQNCTYAFDLIIRDDGSTDETINIINSYKDKYQNIILLRGNNIGYVASFFELLSYAYERNYSFFSFSDQDDYWLENKLQIAVDTLKKGDVNKPTLYSCCSYLVDEKLNIKGSQTQKKRRDISIFNGAIQNICPGHNQVMNRKLAHEILNNTLDLKYIYSQDLWFSMVCCITGKIIFDNSPHTLYRIHSNNSLSYGANKIFWILERLKRINNSESKKMSLQLYYLLKKYRYALTNNAADELELYFKSQKSFFKRLKYIFHTKLYRQSKFETLFFKFLYLLGGYNI